VTTDAPPDDSGRSDRLIEDVSDAARSLRYAEDQHRSSARRLSDTLLAAHEGGFTWSEIARAADLGSAETARGRAYRARETDDIPPSLRWRRERGRTPRPDSERPGVSVTEAAKRLGVSRDTVYARMRNGKLKTTTDDAGRTRVLLEED
jgi:excisionase family DNA binding protein